ncbi:MAG: hypothetical protein LBT46_07070 [Planctomycetaceae bacterium]|jgi:hypothetical protein|nr:hypothetical protein [Planctomycetaceae bacterium]
MNELLKTLLNFYWKLLIFAARNIIRGMSVGVSGSGAGNLVIGVIALLAAIFVAAIPVAILGALAQALFRW